jgi:hypothetical protein
MPILTYRLVCSMDEIERRVRNRGLPQVETEVQRARQLVAFSIAQQSLAILGT